MRSDADPVIADYDGLEQAGADRGAGRLADDRESDVVTVVAALTAAGIGLG